VEIQVFDARNRIVAGTDTSMSGKTGTSLWKTRRKPMKQEQEKKKVRVERVDTKCGAISHMTVDEIKDRTIGENINVTCPGCGAIHLTREDAEEAEKKRITDTPKYKKIEAQAEEAKRKK
jgi:hypothetical protein